MGGKGDMLILIGVLAPDINTDRSGKIEMVELYQSSKVADQIKEYNRKYQNGKNRLGITHIVDSNNEVLFRMVDETEMAGEWEKGYTCIRTPVKIYDNTWYIESYVKTSQLTEEFLHISIWLFLVAIVLFLMITYYSSYFIRRIVKPIESVNQGLKEVEDGKLDVHIEPSGQYEIRNMIHQFNAMVRRLREMFEEYEAKIATGKNFAYYFRELMADRLTVSEVEKENKGFFQESFLLLGVYTNTKTDKIEKIESIFEHHAKYASRCTFYKENASCIYLSYRIMESDYEEGLHRMIREIQRNVEQELNLRLFFVTGRPVNGPEQLEKEKEAIKEKLSFRFLMKEDDILDERVMAEESLAEILSESAKYEALSNALFMADEKNVISEREKLFETYRMSEPEKLRREVYSIILAIGRRAEQNETSLQAIFGQQYNYLDKVGRIEDTRGIRLWLTNFINWILDYSAAHLDLKETDVVALAKRYISEQYENSDLTLKDVADYVGLNDKYFSNRFTKEAGETMSEYLTAVRLQKAKELLRTTNFKVYEIAEMVGYHTLENFNRMFKKNMQISPTEYRKSNNAEK